MPRIQCERCGFEWDLNSTRQKTVLCASCRARKVQTVHTKKGKCLPWHGGFAGDDVTPLMMMGGLCCLVSGVVGIMIV